MTSFKNTVVTKLNFEGNHIGNDGAIALANMLAVNKTITQLDLQDNKIGTSGWWLFGD
jgi:hypothetical protein